MKWLLCLLVFFFAGSSFVAAHEKRSDEIEFALEATMEWSERVSFKGGFSLFEGTLPDSQLKDFLSHLESVSTAELLLPELLSLKASGEIVALNGVFRLKVAYVGGTELVNEVSEGFEPPANTTAVRNAPFEQVFGKVAALGEEPLQLFHEVKDSAGTKSFGNVVGVSNAPYRGGIPSARIHFIPTPLSLDPLGAAHLFSTPGEVKFSKSEESFKFELREQDGTSNVLRTVVLWTLADYPVVSQITGRGEHADGSVHFEFGRYFADFVKVDGGFFAARTVVFTSKQIASGDTLVQVFHSDDLGRDAVSEDDLEVFFPDNAIVTGLAKLPPPENGQRRLNLVKLLPSDLEPTNILNPAYAPGVSFANSEPPARLLTGINLAVVACLLVILGWRKLRKAG